MHLFEVLIGRVMPFVTLAILTLGLVWRIQRWQKAAVANVALHPWASSRGQLFKKVISEVVLFSSFRKQNKELWRKTWFFHITLLMIIVGHLRVFFAWTDSLLGLAMSQSAIDKLSAWGGGLFGIVALVTCVMLLNRRFNQQRVKEASTGEDYYVLILLMFILITGNAMRFFAHFDLEVTRSYFGAFMLGESAVLSNPLFLLHFFGVQILLMYLPFGKFLHIPGVFYSKALMAKDY